MSHIYIALVDTPGILAFLIRSFLKQKYIHVVLSMDAELKEAYSVGRRNPMVPVIAGFEREEKEKVLRAFPTAEYCIYELECTAEQKAGIRETLRKDYEKRFHFHYAVLGLLFILLQRPFYQKNHFTCSSYIAKLLEENQILIADRHFSLVTPRDFMLYGEKRVIFEGSLREFIRRCDPGFFNPYGSAGFPAKYSAKYPAESVAKSPAKYLLAASGERWYSEQCRQLPEYQNYDREAVYER